MALSIDKPKLDNLANGIWQSAERLRGKFKAWFWRLEKEAETNSLRNGGGLCRREAFHPLFPMRAFSPIRARRFTLTGFSEDEKRTE